MLLDLLTKNHKLLTIFSLTPFAKDITSNLVKGFYVTQTLPVHINDNVKIKGYSGKLLGMNLSYMSIECKDRYVYLPTHTVIDSVVERMK